MREDFFSGDTRLYLKIEFQQLSPLLQFTHIGKQVARSERGMGIACVERG